jgi:3-hydroxyisobutyrate dehydrogenase-like beta-hydroxyacid dehydrogenase
MRLRLGFLGLGTMGEPLANNLRKAGHELTVWNRTAARAEPLVRKGAALAATPRACAEGKDAVFTCVSDERALEALLEGPDGLLAGLQKGDVLVDLSTCGTRSARAMAERCKAKGVRFVAAPLFGSRAAAVNAQVVVVAGGSMEARDRVRPALHAMSARIFELDSAAQAALMKLCVNSVGGAMTAALGEALALGASGGLEAGTVLEVLQASAFQSPHYTTKGRLVLKGDFAPRFKLGLAAKDQRLVQEAAADQGSPAPVNAAVRQVLAEAAADGQAEQDVAAVAGRLLELAKAKG